MMLFPFTAQEFLADLAVATGGHGVAVTRFVNRRVAHQEAPHHPKANAARIALGCGAAEFQRGDRGEFAALKRFIVMRSSSTPSGQLY